MNFLVKAWKKMKDHQSKTDFWEFETLEEAKDFADWKAKQLKKYGYEFDIQIYELTNY